MGWDVETTTEPVARKDYHCMACDWIHDSISEQIFNFSELRLIAKAKKENWQIKKGQKYIKVSGKWDGEWCTFRARPEINDLCQKHDIYQE
tara:strand:+ start:1175 stop:1447 length:273 start_codon:yes stop_codon:yes gene_type:complete